MQILLSILGILLFIGLVIVHEWGHFFAARRNGVEVEEFGLGFPPRAWGRKLKSGMVLSLNWLPLGGFVKLKGEHDNDDRPGSLGAASLWVKTKILLAGVVMNALTALAILTVLALIGLPDMLSLNGQKQFSVAGDTKISHQEALAYIVEDGSPAQKAGLKELDEIKLLTNGKQTLTTNTSGQLSAATKYFAGQSVQINIERSGQPMALSATLNTAAYLNQHPGKGYLGVQPYDLKFTRSTWSAPITAVGFSAQLTQLTFKGLWHAISGFGSWLAGLTTGNHRAAQQGGSEATSQVGGPVAIAKVLWGSGTLGINYELAIIAIISLTLAIMNILPIPALDGGRLALMIFARKILRRPLSHSAEEAIVGASMALILGLIALITIVDVRRFF